MVTYAPELYAFAGVGMLAVIALITYGFRCACNRVCKTCARQQCLYQPVLLPHNLHPASLVVEPDLPVTGTPSRRTDGA